MSYDYLLFRAPADGPMASWPAGAEPEPLGTADELKARVEALFPGVRWRSFQDSFFGTWEDGERYAEFQLTPWKDGSFNGFSMKRVEREEVERVCRQLGLVAVDPAVRVYSPALGRWTDEQGR